MLFLLRLLTGLLIIYFVCRFFYLLGTKSVLNKKQPDGQNNRKRVDSTVVDKKQDQRSRQAD